MPPRGSYISDNEQQARGPNLMDFKKAREAGLIQKFNPLPAVFRSFADIDQYRHHRGQPSAFCRGCNVWLGARRHQIVFAGHRL